jgi:SAM-dependent methyltransferase
MSGKTMSPAMTRLHRVARQLKAHLFKQARMAEGFGKPYLHEKMLLDRTRCEAYRAAIKRCVRPGDVVVDLGAGTGLLSFFAIRAGAARVYAIEVSNIADLLAELSRANGMEHRIRVMRGNSKKITLPERADVLITETLSDLGFDNENIVDYVNDVRRRMLKPDARVIPESCRVLLMPFQSDEFGLGGLPAQLYDLDYAALRAARYGDKQTALVRGNGKQLVDIAEPAPVWHLDLRRELATPRTANLEFRVRCGGRLDGFLGWFDATLTPGVKARQRTTRPRGTLGPGVLPCDRTAARPPRPAAATRDDAASRRRRVRMDLRP